MTHQQWLQSLFNSIDNKDTNAFVSHLSEDCIFRFGNMPAVTGGDAIREAVGGFFASIKTISHEITEAWATADQVSCHGMVTYQRHDDSLLSVPFANIMKKPSGANIASEYLIFAAISELYSES